MPASVTNDERSTMTYLHMPGLGDSGGGINGAAKCATPSKESFNVYDDFEMIVKAEFSDEDTYSGAVLMSKWRGFGSTGGTAVARRTYRLVALSFGLDFFPEFYRYFQISCSEHGAIHDAIFNTESIYDLTAGTPFWLKCYFTCDENGGGVRSAAQMWYSLDTTNDPSQVTWIELATGPQGGTGTGNDDLFANLYRDGTDVILYGIGNGAPGAVPLTQLTIGGNDKPVAPASGSAANSSVFAGNIYYAALTTDGTQVMEARLYESVEGATTFTDTLGNVFTLSSTAAFQKSGTLRTMTNEQLGSASLTWDQANFSWDSATGTWDNPYTFANETKHSGSITNESIS